MEMELKIQGGYKNLRLKTYDYCEGWFFVTNKTDFSRNYFIGEIRQVIKSELINLANKTEGVEIDYFHIMPNHIHAILIFQKAEIPLPEFWRRFKALSTYKSKKIGFRGKTLWQRNYFEHVIRNEVALNRIREYIQNNPLKDNLPLQEIYEEINKKFLRE